MSKEASRVKTAKYVLNEEQLGILRDIGNAASNDESRQVITCVCIDVAPKKLLVRATDSYILACRVVTEEVAENEPKPKRFSVIVPAAELTNAAKAALKKPKRFTVKPREVVVSEDGIELQTFSGSIKVNAYDDGPHGYPKFESILSKAFESIETSQGLPTIAFAPDKLSQLSRALGCQGDAQKMGVRLAFADASLDPILVCVDHHEQSFGLLMPIRINEVKSVSVSIKAAA